MNEEKKKKVLIGAGLGSFIIITLFAFLLFNHDDTSGESKKQEDIAKSNKVENSSEKDESSSEKDEEVVLDTTNKELKKSNFNELIFNGERIILEQDDVQISKEGDVLISSKLLEDKLDLPVSWESGILYIGKQPVEGTNEVANYLSDQSELKSYMDTEGVEFSIVKDRWEDNSPFSIATTQFKKGLAFSYSYPFFYGDLEFHIKTDYNFGGEYKKFKADVGVSDNYKNSNTNYIFKFYGDDRLLHETKSFQGGDFTESVEVDVTGVIRFTIELQRVDGKNELEGEVIIGNPIIE